MRKSSIFWGVIILALGFVLLLLNFGLLSAKVWGMLWPIGLVLLGIWFLVGPRLMRGESTTRAVAIPLDNATEAEVEFNHGAGRLEVHALGESAQLVDGSFGGGVETNLRNDGGRARLTLKVPSDAWASFPWNFQHEGFRWSVGLNRSIPLRLVFNTGAGETSLDLRDLLVKVLKVETGASSTVVTLPAAAGYTRMDAHTGMASLDIRIPEGVGARIRVKSGMAGINIDRARFLQQGNEYISADYETAANRAEIDIETGMGSVDVR